jgi:hypothetical protein
MQMNAVFYPAWRVQAQVQCAWSGRYSEQRAVTKYRKVWVQTGTGIGNGYNKQEAYTDYETIWHPCNGTEFLALDFYVPAAPGMSIPQLQSAVGGSGNFPFGEGLPPSMLCALTFSADGFYQAL